MEFDIWNDNPRPVRCARNDDVSWFPCKKNANMLTVGQVYNVTGVDVQSWHTEVYLAEIPGVAFNSVLFEEMKGE